MILRSSLRLLVVAALGAGCSADPSVDVHDAGTNLADSGTAPKVVRFAVFGDAGEGNTAQYALGAELARVCGSEGCDFVLYLGDNFYSSGVASLDDEQFVTKFEMPYADVPAPFHVALGNHDTSTLGLNVIHTWDRGAIQVRYSEVNPNWRLPSEFYTWNDGHALFLALDTNALLFERTTSAQATMVDEALARSTRPWRIAFGHHPYLSNGKHGNAGGYDGALYALLPDHRGDHWKAFFDDHLCGRIDVFFAGHDHNRQWLGETCGTVHVVSGAGSKTEDLVNRDGNAFEYQDDQETGFFHVELDGDTMHVRAYDAGGNVDFETLLERPSLGAR